MTYLEIRSIGAELASSYVEYPADGWSEIALTEAHDRLVTAERELVSATNKTAHDRAQSQVLDLRSALSKAGDNGRIFEAGRGQWYAVKSSSSPPA